jgi:hypothetical protein
LPERFNALSWRDPINVNVDLTPAVQESFQCALVASIRSTLYKGFFFTPDEKFQCALIARSPSTASFLRAVLRTDRFNAL